MRTVAVGLTSEQMRDVAVYFAALPAQRSGVQERETMR
jgi:hypothetical protein